MRQLFIYLFFGLSLCLTAQVRRNTMYVDYINQYSGMAVEQMRKHGIPASITLAQGLLESGAGRSELARRSNNHFGIKCGSSWRGKTTRHTDDRPNECFRVYKNVSESFEDHSLFLKKPRYSSLFRLDIQDYKGWAKGLKACGYATSKIYATQLINIIEVYDLTRYDAEGLRIVYFEENNGLDYVIVRDGDTWESLSERLDISKRKLRKYNDAYKGMPLYEGDIIYAEKKKRRAAKSYKEHPWHTVRSGESMHSISQLYGIRMERLYKMNYKEEDYVPKVGDLLKIR